MKNPMPPLRTRVECTFRTEDATLDSNSEAIRCESNPLELNQVALRSRQDRGRKPAPPQSQSRSTSRCPNCSGHHSRSACPVASENGYHCQKKAISSKPADPIVRRPWQRAMQWSRLVQSSFLRDRRGQWVASALQVGLRSRLHDSARQPATFEAQDQEFGTSS